MPESRLSRSTVRFAIAAVAVVLVSALLPTTAALAAADSDIPGVPLPGSVVTGRLGGPIYDRVFQLDVEPNRIILLSLTGDAGTDFDLYLFDASATSVYGGTGQVASSTGPTSTESISYPARSGGRYYIDAAGFSEAEGNFRLVVAVAEDTTLPGAEVRLNGGAKATTDPTVRVTVVGTDDLSGVQDVQFSEDGTTWTGWQPYRPLLLWTFEDRDGPKRLWARVRDSSDNVSKAATAEIVLDRVRPTVLDAMPAPGSAGISASATVRVRFSEPIDEATLRAGGISLQDAAGQAVPASIAWDAAANTVRLTPTRPLAPATTYTAAIGPVADFAGNQVVEVGAWSFTVAPVREHVVTLEAAASTVTYGGTVRVSGSIDLPMDAQLVLERSLAGGAWSSVAALVPNGSGEFARTVPASGTARYRARIVSSTTEGGLSPIVRVLVRRGVTISGAAGIDPQGLGARDRSDRHGVTVGPGRRRHAHGDAL